MQRDESGSAWFGIKVCAASMGEIYEKFFSFSNYFTGESTDLYEKWQTNHEMRLLMIIFCYIKHNLKYSYHTREQNELMKFFYENEKEAELSRDKRKIIFTNLCIKKLASMKFKAFCEKISEISLTDVRIYDIGKENKHTTRPMLNFKVKMRKQNTNAVNNDFFEILEEASAGFFDMNEIYPILYNYDIEQYIEHRDHRCNENMEIFKQTHFHLFNRSPIKLHELNEVKCVYGMKKHKWECMEIKYRPISFQHRENQFLVYHILMELRGFEAVRFFVLTYRSFWGIIDNTRIPDEISFEEFIIFTTLPMKPYNLDQYNK